MKKFKIHYKEFSNKLYLHQTVSRDAEGSTVGEHRTLDIYCLAARGTRKSETAARLVNRSSLIYEPW